MLGSQFMKFGEKASMLVVMKVKNAMMNHD
jgi:hypothetical protein